ncbi:MAG: DUF1697 domain-containing protein [Acidimicrobiales bacterium]
MQTHVALLRAINVGGRNKLGMAELRQVVAALGHGEVTTYIQSGNALFSAADPGEDVASLAEALEVALSRQLGIRPPVVVVSRDGLDRVVRENPFPPGPNPKAVHAVFLQDTASPGQVLEVAAAVARARAKGSQDEACVVDRTLYMWTPAGLGRSVLALELNRRTRGSTPAPTGTARNWATVTALQQLLTDS